MATISTNGKAKSSPVDKARKAALESISHSLMRTSKNGKNDGSMVEALQACRDIIVDVAGYYALLVTDDASVNNEDIAATLTADLTGVVSRDWKGYTPENTAPGKRNRVEEFASFAIGKASGGFRCPAKPIQK